MPHSCSSSDMAGTSTPYPGSRTKRRPEITGHRNDPGTRQHQGSRPDKRRPSMINSGWGLAASRPGAHASPVTAFTVPVMMDRVRGKVGSVAGADLVTSLRRAGVNRGDLVALVVSPAFEF